MHYSSLTYAFIIVTFFILQSCKSNPSDPFNPQNGTFEKEQINAETATLNAHGNLLLAGTTEGAFKKPLDNNAGWNQAGLKIDSAQVIDFAVLGNQEILAAIKYDKFNPENSMLFKSEDAGNNWVEDSSTSLDEVKNYSISAIEQTASNPNKLFVYRGHIIKSNDAGVNWNVSFDEGFVPEFLTVSPYHANQIWTGGWTNIFSPYLAKSTDGGDSWTLLNKNVQAGDATCYDVVLHPDDPDQVLVGMGGAVGDVNRIRKSTDGGKSWQNVLQGYNIRTLTHSARNPQMVYASGINENGTLFFAVSNNFGENWEVVDWENSPNEVKVSDMVSVMEEDHEVLYFGTNHGVFSYTFEG